MAKHVPDELRDAILTDRRAGTSSIELQAKYSVSKSWLTRHFRQWLSPEELQASRNIYRQTERSRELNRAGQAKAEAALDPIRREERRVRLTKLSQQLSAEIQSGKRQISPLQRSGMSARAKVRGRTPEVIARMRSYAAGRKKYHPDVMKAHLDTFGLKYTADLSSSDNAVTFRWPNKTTRRMTLKKAMRLDTIAEPCISIPERELFEWIKEIGMAPERRRFEKREIDVYVATRQLGLELNGMFWHSDSVRAPSHLLDKTKFFAECGIQIIHIFENEWSERRPQIQNFLRSKLGLNASIGARTLVWRPVSISEAKRFMETQHIQGANSHSTFAVGGYRDDQLVVCATFGSHHRNRTQIVLNRFACVSGLSVSGGLSKITRIALKHFQQDIITWADRRWSTGAGYLAAGWEKEAALPPDYHYWSRKTGVVAKQSRMKRVMKTPEGMTEAEHARADRLLRMWDCGKIRFIARFLP